MQFTVKNRTVKVFYLDELKGASSELMQLIPLFLSKAKNEKISLILSSDVHMY